MAEIILGEDALKLLQRTFKRIRRRELLRTEEITAIYALAGHGCIVAKALSGLYMQGNILPAKQSQTQTPARAANQSGAEVT